MYVDDANSHVSFTNRMSKNLSEEDCRTSGHELYIFS